jgi:phage antirepressor YoqD-like protein
MQSQFEHVSEYNQTFSIEEAAKLTSFPGGEHKFYKWLRSKKFILENNFPSQRMIDLGYFKVFNDLTELVDYSYIRYGPRVKIKGLAYFSKLIAREFLQCPPCIDQADALKN